MITFTPATDKEKLVASQLCLPQTPSADHFSNAALKKKKMAKHPHFPAGIRCLHQPLEALPGQSKEAGEEWGDVLLFLEWA